MKAQSTVSTACWVQPETDTIRGRDAATGWLLRILRVFLFEKQHLKKLGEAGHDGGPHSNIGHQLAGGGGGRGKKKHGHHLN